MLNSVVIVLALWEQAKVDVGDGKRIIDGM
jgi:hypothetical protein